MITLGILALGLSPALASTAAEIAPWSTWTDLRGSTLLHSPVPVDIDGSLLDTGVWSSGQLIFGGAYSGELGSSSRWSLLAEGSAQGDLLAGETTELEGAGMPGQRPGALLPRQLALKLRLPSAALNLGMMTSQWGLGLVANSGLTRWEPGTATFSDVRGGDVVLRAQAATRFGPDERPLSFTAFGDMPWEDDILFEGDRAWQAGGALVLGAEDQIGVYTIRRSTLSTDGDETLVWVADVYGNLEFVTGGYDARVAAEGILVTGQTGLSSTPDLPEHDILQLGAMLHSSLSGERAGGVLDLLYASGDRNADDDTLHAFKADPRLQLGVLLHPVVLAGMTARGVATASNPDVVGEPAEDLERFPTYGGVSNSITLNPRAWWRVAENCEVYGGPLFAWSEVEWMDPFQSRLAGGSPRNSFGGEPGRYLGTELDVGVQGWLDKRDHILRGGLEGALLLPGSALVDADGSKMDTVWGGRLQLAYHY